MSGFEHALLLVTDWIVDGLDCKRKWEQDAAYKEAAQKLRTLSLLSRFSRQVSLPLLMRYATVLVKDSKSMNRLLQESQAFKNTVKKLALCTAEEDGTRRARSAKSGIEHLSLQVKTIDLASLSLLSTSFRQVRALALSISGSTRLPEVHAINLPHLSTLVITHLGATHDPDQQAFARLVQSDRELVSLVKIKSLTVTGSSEANKVIIDDFAILKTLECLDLGEYDTPLDLSVTVNGLPPTIERVEIKVKYDLDIYLMTQISGLIDRGLASSRLTQLTLHVQMPPKGHRLHDVIGMISSFDRIAIRCQAYGVGCTVVSQGRTIIDMPRIVAKGSKESRALIGHLLRQDANRDDSVMIPIMQQALPDGSPPPLPSEMSDEQNREDAVRAFRYMRW